MSKYLCCCKCGGSFGTLVKLGDGRYAHQREQDCIRQRKQDVKESRLVIARPRIILSKGERYGI